MTGSDGLHTRWMGYGGDTGGGDRFSTWHLWHCHSVCWLASSALISAIDCDEGSVFTTPLDSGGLAVTGEAFASCEEPPEGRGP